VCSVGYGTDSWLGVCSASSPSTREWTVQQIADLYDVPRTTVYGYLTSGNRA